MNNLLLSKKKKAIDNFNRGNFDVAEKGIKQVCQKAKRDSESWFLLGLICANKGKHLEAGDAFSRVIAIGDNKYIKDASVNLGVALSTQKKYKESRSVLEKVIVRYPDEADAYINLVTACLKLFDFEKAFEYGARAVELSPKEALAHQNYASVCSILEKYDLAEHAFENAIRLDRTEIKSYIGYARMLGHSRQYARGLKMCDAILTIESNNKEALSSIFKFKIAQGKIPEAISGYQDLMRTGKVDAHGNGTYLMSMQYDHSIVPSEMLEAHKKWGSNCSSKSVSKELVFKKNTDLRLRIAYVSGDFRRHSVAYFLESVFKNHDRRKVEIFCFAHIESTDEITDKFKEMSDHWFDITNLSGEELAALGRSEGIDIAVDLSGHSGHSRLNGFAYRLAPVQITYLGYPATTGLPEMDFRFVDESTDPDDYDKYSTEELVKIPDCFLCYSNGDIPVLDRDGLSEEVIFCSFNNLSKVNELVIAAWSKVLHDVIGSKFLMKNKSFDDEDVRADFANLFNKFGIESSRLQLVGTIKSNEAHMQLYSQVDIALDTFPYNGTTTTCEAMWMGVPVVTLCGDRHSARVGNSLLNAIGQEDWVAHSEDEYIKIASDLASDKDRLKKIKSGLRKQMQESVLCDGPGFTAKLETIYKDLYQRWLENKD